MNKLVTAVALATLIASPAFAQSYAPEYGSGNIAPRISGQQVPAKVFGAYASARLSVKPFTAEEKAQFDRASRPGY